MKSPAPAPQALTEIEMEEGDLELTSSSLEAQAQQLLKPSMIRILKKIAYYTAKVGLPLNEACLLVDVEFDKFQEEMKLEPLIAKIIHIKELEYKKDLLYTLSQRARSGDDKLAAWLLERRYPLEYGDHKQKTPESDVDVIFQAIQFIRKRGSNDPLVSESSGQAIVIKREEGTGEVITERIETILGTHSPSPSVRIFTQHPHAQKDDYADD